jgi:hypothetical protein
MYMIDRGWWFVPNRLNKFTVRDLTLMLGGVRSSADIIYFASKSDPPNRTSSDSALTTASAEVKWINGWSAAATFEGEFSDVTRSYAGKGAVRYAW